MFLLLVHIIVVAIAIVHVLLRPHRQPESRMAWLVVLLALPYLGVLGYVLFGTTNVGHRRAERLKAARASLPRPEGGVEVAGPHAALFRVGQSISGYPAVGGNRAALMSGSDAAIDAMIADIDAAQDHVHVLFYIWLDDHNGRRMAEALMRAARRGVTCRALIDDIGSRSFLIGPLWRDLAEAGVLTRRALPVGIPLLRILSGRIDLRNHRKIVVIDNAIAYCGSQNCADPAFLPKARFAPWVDAVMRFTGPVVRECQHLFAGDWMGNGGDDLAELLRQPPAPPQQGFPAQVVASGPTFRASAMPEMFEALIYAASRELIITTPYYVPNAALQAALCAAANRGVAVTIIFPARNDDLIVGATSRSYYESLLEAGVTIYEYEKGLLHTKSLTLDGEITFLGSANMDRRSFDLNYENNVLIQNRETTAVMRARQQAYQDDSRRISLEEVRRWSIVRRLFQNAVAIFGPLF